jgi:hypothetical protein
LSSWWRLAAPRSTRCWRRQPARTRCAGRLDAAAAADVRPGGRHLAQLDAIKEAAHDGRLEQRGARRFAAASDAVGASISLGRLCTRYLSSSGCLMTSCVAVSSSPGLAAAREARSAAPRPRPSCHLMGELRADVGARLPITERAYRLSTVPTPGLTVSLKLGARAPSGRWAPAASGSDDAQAGSCVLCSSSTHAGPAATTPIGRRLAEERPDARDGHLCQYRSPARARYIVLLVSGGATC